MMRRYEVEVLEKALRDAVDHLAALGVSKHKTYTSDWYWNISQILKRNKDYLVKRYGETP